MVLLSILVAEDMTGGWWVRALFDVGGRQFAARWPFASEDAADQFADDPGVVAVAGAMALDAAGPAPDPATPSEAIALGLCPGCLGHKTVVKLWLPGCPEGPCSTCEGSGTWPPPEPQPPRRAALIAAIDQAVTHPPMRKPCGCPLDADCNGYHPGALDGWPP
jgi:hypothetical protein